MIRLLVLLMAVVALAFDASAQSLDELRVGHWVQAKGLFDGDNTLVVSGLEVRVAGDSESVVCRVDERFGSSRFSSHGQEFHTSSKTKFRKVSLGGLEGRRVKIEGLWRGPRNFSCRSVSLRGEGRDRIVGRVDAIEDLEDGSRRLRIMSFELLVSSELEVEADLPLADFVLIEPRFIPRAISADERDDDDYLPGTIRLTDKLTFGGQLEWKSNERRNNDLDDNRDGDRTDHLPNFRGELVYQAREDLYFLAGFRQAWAFRNEDGSARESTSATRLTEAFGYWRDVYGAGFDLQIGRQDFDEEREWLYDQNLDAVRVILDRNEWRGEFSYSTTLSSGSPLDESSRNWIAYISNNDSKRHLGAYWIDRNDRKDTGGHPVHFGARAHGDWIDDHLSWAEFSVLRGESLGRGNSGYGFDVGTTWAPNGEGNWGYTAGYALGSGDSSATGTNGNFAQTGLNDNNGKLLGVTSFRYYGELLDPELSNLSILTVGIGKRFGKKSSIDFLLHKYDQLDAVGFLRDTNLRATPDGVHSDLGWELDIVFGSRAIDHWSFEVVLGVFQPGDAFPGADDAWLGRFQARYHF